MNRFLESLSAFEAVAAIQMPREQWEWVVGGAESGRTLALNRDQFRKFSLSTRLLTGVDRVSCATSYLGVATSTPIVAAPLGHMTQFNDEGELAIVRGCGSVGAHCVVSMHTRRSLELLAVEAGASGWSYQIYLYSDLGTVTSQSRRAVDLGAASIVVTAGSGHRSPSYQRQQFPWDARRKGQRDEPDLPESRNDRTWTWSDLEKLCEAVRSPVVLKGIQSVEDARRALSSGVSGIWLSNHGGRDTETDHALLQELPRIREAVGLAMPIVIDGGFRTGSDVAKALLLGASNVAVGRPMIHGSVVAGDRGVSDVVQILTSETAAVLGSLGVGDVRGAFNHRSQVAVVH